MLEVFGIIFLSIIAIILLIVGIFFFKAFRQTASYQKAAAIIEGIPQENITLRQLDEIPWKNPDAIDYNASQLKNNGFEFLNNYIIPELGGVRMMAFANNENNAQAVIYEHPENMTWVDIYVPYQDESSLSISSVPEQGQLSRPEKHKMIARAGADTSELLSLLNSNIEDKPTLSITSANFGKNFENLYAEEIKWRKSEGNFSEDDLQKIAKNSGVKLSKKDIEITQMMMQGDDDDVYELEEKCMSIFSEKTKLNVAQWEKIRDYLFIIHEKMSNDEIIDIALSNIDDLDEGFEDEFYKHEESSLPPRELFTLLNEKLPEAKRINKLDEITSPLSADLYYSNMT